MFFAILLNLFSSYFIGAIFNNLTVIFVSFFALIILNIEFLSLFNLISPSGILILNSIFFIVSFLFFKKNNYPKIKFDFDFCRFKNSLSLDILLSALFVGFLIFLIIQFFICSIMPVLEPDAQTYHFLRAVNFVLQKNLNHFETNDARALIMPINSEIIYSYFLAFKKNFYGFNLINFFSFLIALISGWNILEEFKFSYRKRLYAIFVFSSLSAIIIQISSIQTDLLLGALFLTSYYLFLKSKNLIYFSSLSFSIVLGIKTTGFIMGLGFFVLLILSELMIEKNKKLEKTKMFFIFSIINFLIFSSYNYILNFIDFNNFLSNNASYQGHRFWGGIQGYIANLIHYIFQSFDFTGFKWGYYLNNKILILKENIFNLINIDKFTGCNVIQDRINIISDEQLSGFGILGFLVFLPSVFYGLFKIFTNKNKRTILLFLLSLIFIVNILVLSMSLAYMVYSIRFIVSFVTLSFIILTYAYKKKGFFRYIVLFFCLFYMILLSTHIKRAPFFTVLKHFKNANYNLEILSENAYKNKVIDTSILGYKIYQTIKEKYKDKKKIAFIKNLNSPALYLKKLGFEGYKIDFLSTIDEDKIKNYDLIILENLSQNDNVFNTDSNLVQYKIENNSVIFNKTNNPDCYFYDIEGNVTTNIKEALERRCFNFNFIKQHAKLDYIELFEPEFLNKLENIYYFLP